MKFVLSDPRIDEFECDNFRLLPTSIKFLRGLREYHVDIRNFLSLLFVMF
jgi:hypothetical protein